MSRPAEHKMKHHAKAKDPGLMGLYKVTRTKSCDIQMPTLIISLCTSQIFILCIFVASASSIVVHVVHGVLDDARLTSHVPKIKESIRC